MSIPESERFSLPRFSIRRKSTQVNLLMLAITLMALLVGVVGHWSFGGVSDSMATDLDALRQSSGGAVPAGYAMEGAERAISTGRALLIGMGIVSFLLAALTCVVLIRLGIRSVALELWIRRMGQGDLEFRVDMKGHDEITELAIALEELRQRSIKAQQLDLVRELSRDLQRKNEELEGVLAELQRTQDQIITRQKLVELGELTAGVAHEIRNPLNFIKNFSEASEELVEELNETLDESFKDVAEDNRRLIDELSQDLVDNMERIRSHGDRANRIVRDMLMIGRGGGIVQPTDINDLLRDHAMLAYHGARAMDDDFQVDLKFELDPDAGEVEVAPDDMSRVFLNIVGNACYATSERSRAFSENGGSYMPTIWLSTERKESEIEIRIRDNGGGIPEDVIGRIFNPFFTTKPTDKGTGLGLSLSNDVVREHGGTITPVSEPGEYTEMIVSIPV